MKLQDWMIIALLAYVVKYLARLTA